MLLNWTSLICVTFSKVWKELGFHLHSSNSLSRKLLRNNTATCAGFMYDNAV